MPGRLVLFVEGKGDIRAVPVLTQRILNELHGYDARVLDREPFRAPLAKLVKRDGQEWRRLLRQAGRTRRPASAILVVLDGDTKRISKHWHTYIRKHRGTSFCARDAAAVLADQARQERAGEAYSLAVVFAMQEFETWLTAGLPGLRGLDLPGNRGRISDDVLAPDGNLEQVRDAKSILRGYIPGYQPTLDQAALADHFDLVEASNRCRSFLRFRSAISQLTKAVREGRHIVSPL